MPTITIDLTVQQASRLSDAWEKQFGVRPNITDVRQHLVRELKAIVYHGERKSAEEAITIPDFNV